MKVFAISSPERPAAFIMSHAFWHDVGSAGEAASP